MLLCCVFCVALNAFGLFDRLLSTRVGEASNPGPIDKQPHSMSFGESSNKKLQFTVCNPSAIHGKVNDFAELGSHVFFVAETSATSTAQKVFEKMSESLNTYPFLVHHAVFEGILYLQDRL